MQAELATTKKELAAGPAADVVEPLQDQGEWPVERVQDAVWDLPPASSLKASA